MPDPTAPPLAAALAARAGLADADHRGAFRAFHGPLEGDPRFVVDVYAATAVVYRHAPADAAGDAALAALLGALRAAYPWLRVAILKERDPAADPEARRGRVAWSLPDAVPDVEVVEHGVRYAVDPLLNQDAGLYLDTRLLRRWLLDHSAGRTVLNTFAYTGSLGVAARAGGAARVVHTDLNARFLDLAKRSTALNGFPSERRDFVARDFFSFVRGAKLRGERFDTVVLDPPFFSATAGGTVDLARDALRLVNKVRPLVANGGALVVVNNALYLSGAAWMAQLEAACAGGWLAIEERIGVPDDAKGYPGTRVGALPTDPAPFDHATKIVVLRVRHKA